jgi:hypothetical protein
VSADAVADSAPPEPPPPEPVAQLDREAWRRPSLLAPDRRRWTDWVEFVFCLAVFVIAAVTPPATADGRANAPFMTALESTEVGGLCVYKNKTGIDCGGCGLTRAFVQIAHGSPREALRLNPLAPVVFLLLIVHTVRLGVFLALRRRLDLGLPNRMRWRLYGALFLAFATLWAFRLAAALAWDA